MDFAALMAKEMGKSKKPSKDTDGPAYMKRSEVEAERKRKYEEDVRKLEEERASKEAKKRKIEEDAAAENAIREEKNRKMAEQIRKHREEQEWEEKNKQRRHLGLPELPRPGTTAEEEPEADDGGEDISEEEVMEKLRDIGEPVTLFAETHRQKLKRYRALTTVMTDGPIPTTLRLVEEKDMKVPANVPEGKEERKFVFRQIASYFTMVLTAYQRAMEAEGDDSQGSKTAYAAMVQTRENLKPLFRQLERGDIGESLLVAIVEIVCALQERRYVDANDRYLRLCIGKAAWPIGVTMVGIHERAARTKLHEVEKGQVMGDEVTRKYLQSIKRCLTFAQVRWPPDDLRQLMG